jgi:hypothetical protein
LLFGEEVEIDRTKRYFHFPVFFDPKAYDVNVKFSDSSFFSFAFSPKRVTELKNYKLHFEKELLFFA